jgi:hypothetical protein
MLALPMMMIRQPETATRRNLTAASFQAGGTYVGYGRDYGAGALNDTRILSADGDGTIIALAQRSSGNAAFLQVEQPGGWNAGTVLGLVNITNGSVIGAPTTFTIISAAVVQYQWANGISLNLVAGQTHVVLVRAIGVGW